MILVGACDPMPSTRGLLATWQAEVDANRIPYSAHIEAADTEFSRRRTQVAFEPVTALLRAMCSGVTRCMYCQDSGGVDVEHYQPKAWYPELVFEWANFLLVCTRCNRKKSSSFPLFHPQPGVVFTPTRKKNVAPRRPPRGAHVLLNPRIDDPSQYLMLDLASTFYFVELGASGSADWLKAHHTIERLDLNDDALPRARRGAYQCFLSSLRCARAARLEGNDAEVDRAREAVATSPCSVVWREMQRQHLSIPSLRDLFREVPDALAW